MRMPLGASVTKGCGAVVIVLIVVRANLAGHGLSMATAKQPVCSKTIK
jgi:hypothetical protein